MTKLSELKVGDRFTVSGTVTCSTSNGRTSVMWEGRTVSDTEIVSTYSPRYGDMEVTKLPDPPRDLVKGERITSKGQPSLKGEYIGQGWAWWDGKAEPWKLSWTPNTEFYEVIK